MPYVLRPLIDPMGPADFSIAHEGRTFNNLEEAAYYKRINHFRGNLEGWWSDPKGGQRYVLVETDDEKELERSLKRYVERKVWNRDFIKNGGRFRLWKRREDDELGIEAENTRSPEGHR